MMAGMICDCCDININSYFCVAPKHYVQRNIRFNAEIAFTDMLIFFLKQGINICNLTTCICKGDFVLDVIKNYAHLAS